LAVKGRLALLWTTHGGEPQDGLPNCSGRRRAPS
jgi:hypothetical protein